MPADFNNNKDYNGFLRKIQNRYRNNRESWNFAIGIFVTLLGIFVSIITIIYSPNNTIIAVSIVGCQVIVLIMSLITFMAFDKNKKLLNDAIEESKRVVENANTQIADIQNMCDVKIQLVNKLSVFQKNINKRINNFLTLICDEADKYYCNVSNIQEILKNKPNDAVYVELCKKQIEDERQKYRISLYNLYNRYIKGVIEETVKMMSYYMRSKNISLNVSITLKMFRSTYHFGSNQQKAQIYTAFRDEETYDNKKEREIGERHYSVDLNADFIKCLSKECYIKNNITADTDDYLNENFPQCLEHYNCTAVVPIICDYKSDKQMYGFLCCDALNKKLEGEIFDKNTANILYSTALTIGMFFDSINSSWSYIADKGLEDFLLFLHTMTYHGE